MESFSNFRDADHASVTSNDRDAPNESDTSGNQPEATDASRHPDSAIMTAPPEGQHFPSASAIRAAIDKWAHPRGYSMSILSSHPGSKIMVCSHYGKTRNTRKLTDDRRQRAHTTQKHGCPFAFNIVRHRVDWESESWSVKYKNRTPPFHNHGQDEKGATWQRRLERSALTEELKAHMDVGLSVNQSHALIHRKNPHSLITKKDIANLWSELVRQAPSGSGNTGTSPADQNPTSIVARSEFCIPQQGPENGGTSFQTTSGPPQARPRDEDYSFSTITGENRHVQSFRPGNYAVPSFAQNGAAPHSAARNAPPWIYPPGYS